MVTVYDVEPNKLIEITAKKLKEEYKLKKPEFVGIVKSGAHRERPPEQEDFWYIRCASILRKLYIKGNAGVRKLAHEYGGRKKRGVKPEKHYPAGRSTIRKAMQELERVGLLVKEGKGRKLSAKGRSFLDSMAKQAAG